MIRSVRDDSLSPRIVSKRPLLYSAGSDPNEDRPAHVRAGSGLALCENRLFVVQDDANFVARVSLDSFHVDALPLPRGEGGRRLFGESDGSKAFKHDFESCVTVARDGHIDLVAFGSGSTDVRCTVLVLRNILGDAAHVELFDAGAFYRSLRDDRAFSGAELNIEGATLHGDRLRLFQRGNGAARDGESAVNATCESSWRELVHYLEHGGTAPAHANVVRYDLGSIGTVPLTFTDATLLPDGRTLFLAAAEDSPDTFHDGLVVGTALGILSTDGSCRHALITHADGSPFVEKPEGIAVDREGHAHLVIDRDDPELPSELCSLTYQDAP